MSLREQLLAIRAQAGELTPEAVVHAATPVEHPLHERFEWDDRVAGHKYRVGQAAELIRSVRIKFVRPSGESGSVRGLIRDPSANRPVYDETDSVLSDPVAREVVLAQMRREWAAFQQRYSMFEEFADMVRLTLEQAS